LLIGIPILLRPDFFNANRFSSQSDVQEKAAILVDRLGEVRDE
jgi:hypothetical protein